MKKWLLIFMSLFMFWGCETKLKNVVDVDPVFVNALKHTQRGNIVSSFETKSVISATYMENNESIRFLVGVYNSDDEVSGDDIGLYNPNYHITLNDNNATSIKVIDKKMAKKINLYSYPFYEKWMNYYFVDFNKSIEAPFKLVYKSKRYGSVVLEFNRGDDNE